MAILRSAPMAILRSAPMAILRSAPMAILRSARPAACLGLAGWLVLVGCDRRVEPFDPDSRPSQPDLSRIFPAGAEQAETQPLMPTPPGGGEGPDPIQGTITLAEGLAERMPPGAVLFLIARPGEAGPPIAARRIDSPQFPLAFSIGPENRMIETLPFQGPLRISARLDADGDAGTRQAGDLQGSAPGAHQPGDRGVALVIDEVLPEGNASAPPASPPPPLPAAPGRGDAIRGTVTLAEGLGAAVPEGAVLFLIARTGAAGPPLAVVRVPQPSFPFEFELGPGDRMIKSQPFAGLLSLTARIDADGDATTRAPGDLQGAAAGSHQPGDSGIAVVIDQVL